MGNWLSSYSRESTGRDKQIKAGQPHRSHFAWKQDKKNPLLSKSWLKPEDAESAKELLQVQTLLEQSSIENAPEIQTTFLKNI